MSCSYMYILSLFLSRRARSLRFLSFVIASLESRIVMRARERTILLSLPAAAAAAASLCARGEVMAKVSVLSVFRVVTVKWFDFTRFAGTTA